MFYKQFTGSWVAYVQGFVMGIGFLWLVLQVYVFPLLIEQEDRRLRIAWRNSLVLLISNPGLALVLIVLLVLLAGLSVVLQIPWLIITVTFSTFLSNWCVLHALENVQARQERIQKE